MKPDEVYNLASQSHVGISFAEPEYTADVTGLGALRLLHATYSAQELLRKEIRFYQASSSEMFGEVAEIPQTEKTLFHPRSPYACAKVFAHHAAVNYREAYGMHASCGILCNHESEERGDDFVTRKITKAVARIILGKQKDLVLGNLNAKRDWGYAADYVEAMWLMLQQPTPGDYVIATGDAHTVRDFVEAAFLEVGITLEWCGGGVNEHGVVKKVDEHILQTYIKNVAVGDKLVRVSVEFYRPAEVNFLLGDATKAKEVLGWTPKTTFKELVHKMVEADVLREAAQ